MASTIWWRPPTGSRSRSRFESKGLSPGSGRHWWRRRWRMKRRRNCGRWPTGRGSSTRRMDPVEDRMARRRRTAFKRAEDSVGVMLGRASNLLQRLHGGCLRSLDVTPTQFSLMTCLMYLQDEGDVTASRIVAHTGMDKMMVSDVLKTLTQKRLVAKERHPRDARASILRPTRRGKAITN